MATSPAVAQSLALQWMNSILTNDTTLAAAAPGGVWHDMAPPQVATPYIIVSMQGGSNTLTATAVRLFTYCMYQVKAVGPANNYAALVAAAARCDQLLDARNVTIPGGIILASYQETPLAVGQLVAGELWNDLGGLYRIAVQEV